MILGRDPGSCWITFPATNDLIQGAFPGLRMWLSGGVLVSPAHGVRFYSQDSKSGGGEVGGVLDYLGIRAAPH